MGLGGRTILAWISIYFKVDNNIFEVIEGVHLVLGEFSLSAGTFLSHWGWVKVGWVVRWMGASKSTQPRACFFSYFLSQMVVFHNLRRYLE